MDCTILKITASSAVRSNGRYGHSKSGGASFGFAKPPGARKMVGAERAAPDSGVSE
jgi:hypothetical protein